MHLQISLYLKEIYSKKLLWKQKKNPFYDK